MVTIPYYSALKVAVYFTRHAKAETKPQLLAQCSNPLPWI